MTIALDLRDSDSGDARVTTANRSSAASMASDRYSVPASSIPNTSRARSRTASPSFSCCAART